MKSKRPTREVKEKSCGVILYRDEKGVREYLLLHYPSGHWDYPKGHVEKIDGTEIDTARRELEEETGIKNIEFESGYREPMYYDFNRGKKEVVRKTVVYFLARSNESSVKLSFEHKNYIWLPYEEALKKLTFENARELMRRGQKHLSNN